MCVCLCLHACSALDKLTVFFFLLAVLSVRVCMHARCVVTVSFKTTEHFYGRVLRNSEECAESHRGH